MQNQPSLPVSLLRARRGFQLSVAHSILVLPIRLFFLCRFDAARGEASFALAVRRGDEFLLLQLLDQPCGMVVSTLELALEIAHATAHSAIVVLPHLFENLHCLIQFAHSSPLGRLRLGGGKAHMAVAIAHYEDVDGSIPHLPYGGFVPHRPR